MNEKQLTMKLDIARKANIDDKETSYYGGCAMYLFDKIGNPHGDTACTDGSNIYWSEKFLEELTHEETRGVCIHEVMHPVHGHLWRFDMDELANQACDYVINARILESFKNVKLPKGCLYDKRFSGLCEEEVYAILKKEEKEQPGRHKGKTDPCGSFTKPASGASKPDQGQDMAKGQAAAAKPGKGQKKGNGEASGDGSGKAQGEGEGKAAGGTKPTLKEQWEQICIQQSQIQRAMQGTVPADATLRIEKIKHQRLDWKTEMADFVKHQIAKRADWSRMARRMATAPVIYPRYKKDDMGLLVIVRDTSGSMVSIMPTINAVIENILGECNVDCLIIDCDADIAEEYRLSPGESVPELAKGGGGTDFAAPFKRVQELIDEGEHLSGMIYITDLYGSGEPESLSHPMLWLCSNDQVAKTGRTVKVELE